MFSNLEDAQEAVREMIKKLARGEALSDDELTVFCRAYFIRNLERVLALAESAEGIPPEEIADLADDVVEELKERLRSGAMIVEISADGDSFYVLAGVKH